MRLFHVLRVEHEQHVLLHRVPLLVLGHLLRRHEQLPRPREPVQLEEPEAVRVEPLAVREQEVESGEGGAVDRSLHAVAQRRDRVARIEVAHQEVEQVLGVRLAHRRARAVAQQASEVHQRAVVAERVVAEAERMRVLGREAAHRRAAHVHVEDASARVGGRAECEVGVGGLREAHACRGLTLRALVHRHAPTRVVLLGLADHGTWAECIRIPAAAGGEIRGPRRFPAQT